MKTMIETFNATSKKHGSVKINLRFCINETCPRCYVVTVECLTDGFQIGGQTTGYMSTGPTTVSHVVDGKLIMDGKKSLSRLGRDFIYLFKDGCDRNKADRFILSVYGVDFSPLTREAGVEKYTVIRSPVDGEIYCIRNVEPRFTVKYNADDALNNIVFTDFVDTIPPDAEKLAKMMRGIGESIVRFLKNEEYERKKER